MTLSTPQNGVYAQMDHAQARYVGTGHPEITQHEWATNIHRDAIASFLGRPSLVEYFAIAEGISTARMRYRLLEKMHRPCGNPPCKRKLEEMEN